MSWKRERPGCSMCGDPSIARVRFNLIRRLTNRAPWKIHVCADHAISLNDCVLALGAMKGTRQQRRDAARRIAKEMGRS